MATTAIKVIKDGMALRSKITTIPGEKYLTAQLYYCNNNFKPIGEPITSVDEKTEEEYHRDLRQASNDKGHFVPEESTNPEWNPK